MRVRSRRATRPRGPSSRSSLPQEFAQRPHERAGLFTAIFFVGYLAMGSSAIIGGLFVGVVGPAAAAAGFGVVTAIVTLVGVVAARLNRS